MTPTPKAEAYIHKTCPRCKKGKLYHHPSGTGSVCDNCTGHPDRYAKQEEPEETHQEAYYRELRLERYTRIYLDGMHRVKHFEHTAVGIELAKRMFELSPHNA